VREQELTASRQLYIDGATAHPGLVAAAAEAGVTILAGTDSHPHGRIIDEIRAIAAAGVPAVDAIGAASWRARNFLGFGGLTDGSPADAVVYDEDPRKDLGQLEAPRAIILRGQVRHRR
jgi:imidazolonepropionase-like amidohydrolase